MFHDLFAILPLYTSDDEGAVVVVVDDDIDGEDMAAEAVVALGPCVSRSSATRQRGSLLAWEQVQRQQQHTKPQRTNATINPTIPRTDHPITYTYRYISKYPKTANKIPSIPTGSVALPPLPVEVVGGGEVVVATVDVGDDVVVDNGNDSETLGVMRLQNRWARSSAVASSLEHWPKTQFISKVGKVVLHDRLQL